MPCKNSKTIILFAILLSLSLFFSYTNTAHTAVLDGTVANTLLTNSISTKFDNGASITNNSILKIATNAGGQFTRASTDKSNGLRTRTTYFTNYLKNWGNFTDRFYLTVIKTNTSGGFVGPNWTYWFEDLSGNKMTNALIPPAETNKFRFAIQPAATALPGSWMSFLMAAKSTNATRLSVNTNTYHGDNKDIYGGPTNCGLGRGLTNIGRYVVIQSNITAQNDDYVKLEVNVAYYVNDSLDPSDRYCSAAGDDINDGLSPGSPKRTITNLLSTYALLPNDIVYIDSGIYNEKVVVGNSDDGDSTGYVTFQGIASGGTNSVINGTGSTGWQGAFELDNAKYIRVDSLYIRNIGIADQRGLLCKNNCTNLKIINNIVVSNRREGIRLANGGSVAFSTISNNICNYNDQVNDTWPAGLLLNNGYSNRIIKNRFSRQGISLHTDSGRGIRIENGSLYNTFLSNTCNSNLSTGIEIYNQDAPSRYNYFIGNICNKNASNGIAIYSANPHQTMIGNQCIGNTNGFFINSTSNIINNNIINNNLIGIRMLESWNGGITADCSFKSNIINNNHSDGFQCCALRSRVTNNIIYKNGGIGIKVDATPSPSLITLQKNIVYSNTGVGIALFRGQNTVFSNQIHHNAGYGIAVQYDSKNNYISGNNIYINDNGIHIWQNSNTITNNIIHKNVNDGIGGESISNNLFINNDFYSNNTCGISLWGGINSYNVFKGNKFRNNATVGLYFTGFGNIVDNNYSSSNVQEGIKFGGGNQNVLFNNTCFSNGSHGIGFWSANQNTLAKNILVKNRLDGVNVGNSSFNLFQNNTSFSNGGAGFSLWGTSANNILKNCITAGNNSVGIYSESALSADFSCIQDGFNGASPGYGTITSPPLFTNTSVFPSGFHTKWNSPAILTAETNNGAQGCMGKYSIGVRPSTTFPGRSAVYRIAFVTSPSNYGSIPANGKIQIEFPTGFGIPHAGLTAVSSLGTVTASWLSGQTIIVINGSGSASIGGKSEYIEISSITNISTSGSNYTVNVTTTSNSGAVIDGLEASNPFRIGAANSIYYVGNTWGSDLNDGTSWGRAFFSIQKAINSCTSGLSNVIFVAGTTAAYTNPLATYAVAEITNCSGASTNAPLNIKGYYTNSTFPIINARGVEKFCFFVKSVTNVSIANFKNRNALIDGLMIRTNANRITIFSNSFFRNTESGISILDSTNIRITKNLIYSNTAHGIFNNRIKDSLFYNNRIWQASGGAGGIYVTNSAANTFTSNTIFSNTHPAIYLNKCKNDTLTGNNCRNGDRAALLIKNCNNERIAGNHVAKSGNDGLKFELSCTNLYIYNNTSASNNASGIAGVDNVTGFTLGKNVCWSNNQKGFYFNNARNLIFFSNTAIFNLQSGISFNHPTNLIFFNNVSKYNLEDGMYLESPINCNIINSTFSNNTRSGIAFNNPVNCLAANNKTSYNNEKGIFFYNSINSLVTNNICRQNPQAGIMAENGRSNTFIRNTCANASWAGLLYKQANQGTFRYNQCVQNNSAGIQFEWACTNLMIANNYCSSNTAGISLTTNRVTSATLVNNTLFTNRNQGIYLKGTKNSLFQLNTITKNADHGILGISLINCRFTSNLISENNKAGIFGDSLINCKMISNQISKNRAIGISINNTSYSNMIKANTLNNNSSNAIYVTGGNNLINGNSVSSNYYGIRLDGSAARNNMISRNFTFMNQQPGIQLINNANSNIIFGNLCVKNSENGIGIGNSSYNLIQNNTCVSAYGHVGISLWIWLGANTGNIVKNCITYGNETGGVYSDPAITPVPSIAFSCIQDGFSGNAVAGYGTVTGDPLFTNTSVYPSGYYSKWNSPVINSAETNKSAQGCMGRYTVGVKPGSTLTGRKATYIVSFVTSPTNYGSIPGNGQIRIEFPSGFKVPGIGTLIVNSTLGPMNVLSSSAGVVVVQKTSGIASSGGKSESISLSIITNPLTTGSNFTVNVTTMDSSGTVIDEMEASHPFRIADGSGIFYVGNTWGNDNNDGTSWPTAFYTIQKGIDSCLSGYSNTVLVAGTPVNYTNTNTSTSPSVVLLTSCSGASTNARLSIIGYYSNSTFPVINGRLNENYGFYVEKTSNIIISHFNIKKAKIDGVKIALGAKQITLRSNTSKRNNRSGLSIVDYCTNIFFINNTCFSNGTKGIFIQNAEKIRLIKNTCYKNTEDGLSMYDLVKRSSFISNSSYNNSRHGMDISGINVTSNSFSYNSICKNNTNGIKIYNVGISNVFSYNTLATNTHQGILSEISRGDRFIHNTSFSNSIGIEIINNNTNCYLGYNNCFNNKNQGIYINNLSRCVLYSNTSRSNAGSGIYLFGPGANHYIASNITIKNKVHGIHLYSNVTSVTLNGNTTCLNDATGIYIDNANKNCIQNTVCFSNQDSGIGLWMGATNLVFKNRVFRNNLNTGGDGIKLENCGNDNSIISNSASSNINHGVYVMNSGSCLIRGNTCITNGKSGIGVIGAANSINIFGNISLLNYLHGITLNSTTFSTVKNNFCQGNFTHGIFLENLSKNNSILSNTCNKNNPSHTDSRGGIKLENSDNNILTGNTAGSNGRHGIFLYNCSSCTLAGNRTFYNNNDGIKSDNSKKIRITGSQSWRNPTGISVGWHCTNILAENNLTYSNDNFGFWIAGNEKTTVQSNQIFGNGGTTGSGIRVQDGGGPPDQDERIINNRIYGNVFGIVITNSGPAMIYRNLIGWNTSSGIKLDIASSAFIINNNILSNQVNGLSAIGGIGTAKNNIFLGNTPNGVATLAGGTVNISYSCTNDGTSGAGITHGPGNITSYTLMTSGSLSAEDWSLFWNSPAIGSGEAGPVLQPSMGYIVQYDMPINSFVQSPADHHIIFKTAYSNGSIPPAATIILTFSRPILCDFKFPASIKVTNTSAWGGTRGTFTAVAGLGAQDVTVTRTGGAWTYAGAVEDIILRGITNASVKASNYKVSMEIKDTFSGKRIELLDGNYFKLFNSTFLSINKTVSNIRLPGNATSPNVPGSRIMYKVSFTNNNAEVSPQYNAIVFDKLPKNMIYWTNYLSTTTGWSLQYSTNTVPDQTWSSTTYTNGLIIPKNTIKWIRWKKAFVSTSEKAGHFVYSVIIK